MSAILEQYQRSRYQRIASNSLGWIIVIIEYGFEFLVKIKRFTTCLATKRCINVRGWSIRLFAWIFVVTHCYYHDGKIFNCMQYTISGSSKISSSLRAMSETNQRELDLMNSCPEFVVCNGRCPHERYSISTNYHLI